MFHIAVGAALILGGCLLVSATFGEAPLLAAQTAAQIIGWLFIIALVADLCAMTVRSHGLRNLPRPSFAQALAGVTTLFTGAFILYMAYFEWSELRSLPMREAAAAIQPPGMPDPSLVPAVQKVAYRPGAVVAINNLRANSPRSQQQLMVATVGAPKAPDACSLLESLPRLWCEEQARLEHCADHQGDEAMCPSPIPASLPY
jgi:hypothetical protein